MSVTTLPNASRDGSSGAPAIELSGVSKRFLSPKGQAFTALRDVNLTVQAGEFCAVVGPSGCGKSTTLTLVSGLEQPSAGEVRVLGQPVRGIDPHVGFMFQTDAVFPWKSVLDNVSVGPRFRGTRKAEAREQARDWIERVGLSGFEDHYPHQLSGGMRKRVALAQTLINEPQIMLMDEPFSALDELTKTQLQDELLKLWSGERKTILFVTHNISEAVYLADEVIVMSAHPGRIRATITVDLPRPRPPDIRETMEFLAHVRRAREALMS